MHIALVEFLEVGLLLDLESRQRGHRSLAGGPRFEEQWDHFVWNLTQRLLEVEIEEKDYFRTLSSYDLIGASSALLLRR